MSPRLRAALYAQAGAVFSLHPCRYAGDRPTAGRSRFATLLPGDAAVSPSNGDHAGTQPADPPPPRNGPKHRGAGRSRSATGPPRQSRSTRQFFCAEVLVDRAQFLAQTARSVTITGLVAEDVQVRLFGDLALIHARTRYRTADGEERQGRYTDVWARRDGKWLAIAAHVTR